MFMKVKQKKSRPGIKAFDRNNGERKLNKHGRGTTALTKRHSKMNVVNQKEPGGSVVYDYDKKKTTNKT